MAFVPSNLAGCNYPIETEIQKKFWGSRHKCNRAKAIIAFSYDKHNAMNNMQRIMGWRHFWRHRAWNAFGQYVNTPDMAGIPFSEGNVAYWECMPNDTSDGGGGTPPPVNTKPTVKITTPSTDMTVGNVYPLIAQVTGKPTPIVKWTANGADIGTGDSITFTPTDAIDYVIKVTATNSEGNATDSQTRTAVEALKPPVFTKQPKSVTVNEGETATFSVEVTGADSVQWQDNENNAWKDIAGATSTSFTTPASTPDMDGWRYRCIATNAAGSTNSTVGFLTVQAVVLVDKTFGLKLDPADASDSSGFELSQPWCYDGPQLPTSVATPNNLCDHDGWYTAKGGEEVVSLHCIANDDTSMTKVALYETELHADMSGDAERNLAVASPATIAGKAGYGTVDHPLDTPFVLEAGKSYCVAYMDMANTSFAVGNGTNIGSKWNVTAVSGEFDSNVPNYDANIGKDEAPIAWATMKVKEFRVWDDSKNWDDSIIW